MEVFVFFIYQLTSLVRAVGGGKLTPYESNCSEISIRVCVRVCALALVRTPESAERRRCFFA